MILKCHLDNEYVVKVSDNQLMLKIFFTKNYQLGFEYQIMDLGKVYFSERVVL
jgi:hypothetical protein